MKVKELIEALKHEPDNAELMVYTDDGEPEELDGIVVADNDDDVATEIHLFNKGPLVTKHEDYMMRSRYVIGGYGRNEIECWIMKNKRSPAHWDLEIKGEVHVIGKKLFNLIAKPAP